MDLKEYVVDTTTQSDELPKTKIKEVHTRKQNDTPKSTVEEQIAEYNRTKELSSGIYNKYLKSGWDTIWGSSVLFEDVDGIRCQYIDNLTYAKLVEYHSKPEDKVLDLFSPLERKKLLGEFRDRTNHYTPLSSNIPAFEQTLRQLSHYGKVEHNTILNTENILTNSGENSDIPLYDLVICSLPTLKDLSVKIPVNNGDSFKDYVNLLQSIFHGVFNVINHSKTGVFLVSDIMNSTYIPILPFLPKLLAPNRWKYTAIIPSSNELGESLWGKFYIEGRFHSNHAYIIGVEKVQVNTTQPKI